MLNARLLTDLNFKAKIGGLAITLRINKYMLNLTG